MRTNKRTNQTNKWTPLEPPWRCRVCCVFPPPHWLVVSLVWIHQKNQRVLLEPRPVIGRGSNKRQPAVERLLLWWFNLVLSVWPDQTGAPPERLPIDLLWSVSHGERRSMSMVDFLEKIKLLVTSSTMSVFCLLCGVQPQTVTVRHVKSFSSSPGGAASRRFTSWFLSSVSTNLLFMKCYFCLFLRLLLWKDSSLIMDFKKHKKKSDIFVSVIYKMKLWWIK